jgi:hypothetical protein
MPGGDKTMEDELKVLSDLFKGPLDGFILPLIQHFDEIIDCLSTIKLHRVPWLMHPDPLVYSTTALLDW